MAKKNKVTQVRRAYVQSRAEATGKTSAQDRAKFRQRFDKLATTSSGRAKIQEVTGISGVRKDLRSAYSAPKSGTQSLTSDTSTTKSSLPGFGVAGKRTYTEAQTEMKLRANPKSYNVVRQTNKTGSKNKTSSPISGTNKGLSGIQNALIGGGAAAALYGASNRAFRLNQIASQNRSWSRLGLDSPATQAQLEGMGGKVPARPNLGTTKSLVGYARGEMSGMLGKWRAGGGLRRGSM